jgi:hypothetical protein
MAIADRLDGIEARHFCLLGDGECSEGSVWESAQFASDHKLERVVAIVDMNGLEQSGPAPYGHDSAVDAADSEAARTSSPYALPWTVGDAVSAQAGRLGPVFHLGIAGEPHSGTPEELLERHRLSG